MVKERQISAGEFKAVCLGLMDEVQRSRKPIVITKRGKPIAKLVPYDEQTTPLYGFMRGSVIVHEDIVELSAADWEVNE